jgi:hypothetical protein
MNSKQELSDLTATGWLLLQMAACGHLHWKHGLLNDADSFKFRPTPTSAPSSSSIHMAAGLDLSPFGTRLF